MNEVFLCMFFAHSNHCTMFHMNKQHKHIDYSQLKMKSIQTKLGVFLVCIKYFISFLDGLENLF